MCGIVIKLFLWCIVRHNGLVHVVGVHVCGLIRLLVGRCVGMFFCRQKSG